MKTRALLTVYSALIIISETNCFYIQNTSFHERFERQAVILRKLQNLHEHDPRMSTQTTSWSEILADILVAELFSYEKLDINTKVDQKSGNTSEIPHKTGVLVKAVSNVLEIYKTYVFDKWRSDYNIRVNVTTHVDENKVEKHVREVNNNPNDDVEIIGPVYHGKLKNETLKDDGSQECEEGFTKDGDGKCIEIKHSKFVMAIPWQCPKGYRADWLGYCRESL